MKVQTIIIVNDYAYIQGGADAVAISSACGLSRMGFNVIFFAAVSPVSSELESSGVKVTCLNKQDILHDTNRLRAVVKGIYDNEVEVKFREVLSGYTPHDTLVHIHTWTKALSSAVFSVPAERKFNVVLTLHDYFTVCPNGGFYNYKKQCVCKLKPLSVKCIGTNCDLRSFGQKQWRVLRQLMQNRKMSQVGNLHLLSISKKVAEVVTPIFPSKNVHVDYLHNPVEILDNKCVDVLSNQKYLFIGRLAEEKGPRLFCQAISQLGLKGVVIGDGYLKESLEKEFPNIEFTGWLSGRQKYNIIKECKCFVFTSRWYETFGLVVAEMKAVGVPSIVPKESAAAEQITDGYNGLLYNIGDLESLKKTILKFEDFDINEMKQNILSSFNPYDINLDSHIDKLVEYYSKL